MSNPYDPPRSGEPSNPRVHSPRSRGLLRWIRIVSGCLAVAAVIAATITGFQGIGRNPTSVIRSQLAIGFVGLIVHLLATMAESQSYSRHDAELTRDRVDD